MPIAKKLIEDDPDIAGFLAKEKCAWPGCSSTILVRRWCDKHWKLLPKTQQSRLTATHTKEGNEKYTAVFRQAQEWIRAKHGCVACFGSGTSTKGTQCHPCNGSGVKQ